MQHFLHVALQQPGIPPSPDRTLAHVWLQHLNCTAWDFGLYRWRYLTLRDLPAISSEARFQKANAGFAYTHQPV